MDADIVNSHRARVGLRQTGRAALALRDRLQRRLAACYFTAGPIVFGVDDARIDAPRMEANELAFAAQLTP